MTASRTPELIAIVEDDPDVAGVVGRALMEHGYHTVAFDSAEGFLGSLPRDRPDLIVLDLGLPDLDGISLLPRLREAATEIPVIILSGRSGDADRIVGLELGADDYLGKPFNPRELIARVRSVLRRARGPARAVQAETRQARFGSFTYNPGTFTLTGPDGGETMLGTAEALLLEAFLDAPNRVLTREYLLQRAARDESLDRAVDVGVSRLRKKLTGGDGARNPIRTVYGAGYMFTAPVDWS